jgi:hypothetical protein
VSLFESDSDPIFTSDWQFDLNYTQDVSITDDYKVQFRADLFNGFDNQTGYRIDPSVDNATFA